MIQLKNKNLEVLIDKTGAEIKSIKNIQENKEYIWDGKPEYWARQAPILFPIVGRVSDDKYMVDGKEYNLNQHGFARDLDFSVEQSNESSVVMSISWSKETLKIYPYKFKLKVTYRLDGNKLSIKYEVQNEDEKVIYFSIGAHPGFNWPLFENENKEDYYLEFESEENCGIYGITENNLIFKEKKPFLKDSKFITLNNALFKEGALVFDNLKSKKVSLKSNKNNHSVTVEFPGFPFLGIWSKESGAPFVCIEPWFGHADYDGFEGDFSEKDDNLSLFIDEKFECEHKIIID